MDLPAFDVLRRLTTRQTFNSIYLLLKYLDILMTRLYCFGKQCTNVYIAGGLNVDDGFRTKM